MRPTHHSLLDWTRHPGTPPMHVLILSVAATTKQETARALALYDRKKETYTWQANRGRWYYFVTQEGLLMAMKQKSNAESGVADVSHWRGNGHPDSAIVEHYATASVARQKAEDHWMERSGVEALALAARSYT
jgi:hypothetical protein